MLRFCTCQICRNGAGGNKYFVQFLKQVSELQIIKCIWEDNIRITILIRHEDWFSEDSIASQERAKYQKELKLHCVVKQACTVRSI